MNLRLPISHCLSSMRASPGRIGEAAVAQAPKLHKPHCNSVPRAMNATTSGDTGVDTHTERQFCKYNNLMVFLPLPPPSPSALSMSTSRSLAACRRPCARSIKSDGVAVQSEEIPKLDSPCQSRLSSGLAHLTILWGSTLQKTL